MSLGLSQVRYMRPVFLREFSGLMRMSEFILPPDYWEK